MLLVNRRAISGTTTLIHVPDVAHNNGFMCHNTDNLAQKHGKSLCQSWHTKIRVIKNNADFYILSNTMINRLFQCCNHRCEVCGLFGVYINKQGNKVG